MVTDLAWPSEPSPAWNTCHELGPRLNEVGSPPPAARSPRAPQSLQQGTWATPQLTSTVAEGAGTCFPSLDQPGSLLGASPHWPVVDSADVNCIESTSLAPVLRTWRLAQGRPQILREVLET